MSAGVEDSEVFRLIAQDLAAEAMERCRRVGLRPEDGARVVLGMAHGLMVAKSAEAANDSTFRYAVSESLTFVATTAYAFRIEAKTKIRKPTT